MKIALDLAHLGLFTFIMDSSHTDLEMKRDRSIKQYVCRLCSSVCQIKVRMLGCCEKMEDSFMFLVDVCVCVGGWGGGKGGFG